MSEPNVVSDSPDDGDVPLTPPPRPSASESRGRDPPADPPASISQGPPPPVMPPEPDHDDEEVGELPFTPKPVPQEMQKTPSSAQSVSSSRSKHGEVIVLGGSLQKNRSYDYPGIQSTPSYELREAKSEEDVESQRRSSAATGALVGGAVVGGAAAGAVMASQPRGSASPDAIPSTPTISKDEEVASNVVTPTSPTSPAGAESSAFVPPPNEPVGKAAKAPTEEPVINHNFSSQPKPRSIMGMSRPAFAALAVAVMAAGGVGAYSAIKLPTLNSQVRDLEKQVNRLGGEVDRLETENDRFEQSNNVLNASIAFLDDQNEMLNETSFRLDAAVDDLEGEIEELNEINSDLREANDKIAENNEVLADTNKALQESVNTLNDTVTNLVRNYEALVKIQQDLQESVTELDELKDSLTEQEEQLEKQVDGLTNETERLNLALDDLEDAITYMNNSVSGEQDDLVETTRAFTDQIDIDRFLGVESINYQFLDAWHGWDCGFADSFPNLVENKDATIPEAPGPYPQPLQNIDTVLNYTRNEFAPSLCFDDIDLVAYLDRRYFIEPTLLMSTNDYIEGINEYTEAGLNYYFPSQGQPGGLTPVDWEEAQYSCKDIPKFQFTS